jgi:acylphosphatase
VKHLNIKISGKVQGVFFRKSAKDIALELQIFGYARNNSDGSLYIEAEGIPEALTKFVDWLKKGPDEASIQKIEITEGTLANFKEFVIK